MARNLATVSDAYGPSSSFGTVTPISGSAYNANGGVAAGNTTAQNVSTTTPTTAGGSSQYSIQVVPVLQGLQSSFLAYPFTWLVLAVGLIIAYKLIEEHRSKTKTEFSELKVGGNNFVKVGLMVLIFFAIAKFLFTKYNVPGLSAFVKYATGN